MDNASICDTTESMHSSGNSPKLQAAGQGAVTKASVAQLAHDGSPNVAFRTSNGTSVQPGRFWSRPAHEQSRTRQCNLPGARHRLMCKIIMHSLGPHDTQHRLSMAQRLPGSCRLGGGRCKKKSTQVRGRPINDHEHGCLQEGNMVRERHLHSRFRIHCSQHNSLLRMLRKSILHWLEKVLCNAVLCRSHLDKQTCVVMTRSRRCYPWAPAFSGAAGGDGVH